MWQYLLLLAVAVLVKGSALICKKDCALENSNTTLGIHVYEIKGKEIELQLNSTHFSLDCNNHELDYNSLPKSNGTIKYDKITFNNCIFSPLQITDILNNLKIIANYLSLNKWQPLNSDIFSNVAGINRLEIKNSETTPKLLENMRNLTELSFLNTNIPNDIILPTELRNLTFVNCTSKSILIPSIKYLILEKFVLSHNKIESFPPNFLNGINLRLIDLSYNKLTDIPVDLLSFTNLEELYLQGNSITSLATNMFYNLSKLKVLNLSHNLINRLPEEIFNSLSKLITLDISHNNLSYVEYFAFPGTSGSLQKLDMSYNKLTVNSLCHSGTTRLDSLHQVRELHLHHNQLEYICVLWTSLPRLSLLDVSHNNISTLTAMVFQFALNNITVDFSDNNITSIIFREQDYTTFSPFKHRKYNLESNPIRCDGKIQWFLRTAREFKLYDYNIKNAICNDPVELRNRPLATIMDSELNTTFDCEIISLKIKHCVCSYYGIDDQILVNCSHTESDFDEINSIAAENPDLLVLALAFEHCNLTEIPSFPNLTVKQLLLAHNNISRIPELPKTLKHLDLRNNSIGRLSDSEVSNLLSGRTVSLSGNQIPCDCDSGQLVLAIIQHPEKISDLPSVRCAGGDLPPTVPAWCGARGALAGGLVAAIVALLGIAGAMYYRYRLEINAILYSRGWLLPFIYVEDLEKDKQYDAFVSYAHGDEAFITEQLIPKLENQLNYKLCVHHRDWLIGPDIPSQILSSVEDSRRTIVVLSKNFLNSVWGRAEFRAAQSETIRTGLPRVLVIMLPDVGDLNNIDAELKEYLASNTYIERNDPLFWQKLCFALPHKIYKTKDPVPMTKSEEKKRLERVKPIAEFVHKEFARRESEDNNETIEIKLDNINDVELETPKIYKDNELGNDIKAVKVNEFKLS